MDNDTLAGEARHLGGKIEESIGILAGNPSLEAEGINDQVAGKLQTSFGAAREAVEAGAAPIVGQVRGFARERPWAVGAVIAVLGIALINTLRGKR